MVDEYVTISNGTVTVMFPGGPTGSEVTGIYMAEDGLEGWYSTPDAKVSMTERGQGDGAHDVPAGDVLYSARTVTLHFVVSADASRQTIVEAFQRISRLAGGLVTFTFHDGGYASYVTGYLTIDNMDTKWSTDWNGDNTLTVVCPRPERLSSTANRFQLLPAHESGNLGLSYGDGAAGLVYPLDYGNVLLDARNVGVILNRGSSRAYPVFTVHGSFPDGIQLDFTPGGTVVYSQPVGAVPLVLDSRSRTASIAGLDVTRHLSQRGFPTVPARGGVTVSLMGSGSGWVDVECRDTYM